MKTEMMFVAHAGTYRNNSKVGIIMNGHALPIAFRETDDCKAEDAGFSALWSSLTDVEEMFVDTLRIDHCPEGPGVYVVTAEFDSDEIDYDEWEHLADCHPHGYCLDDIFSMPDEGWVFA